MNEGKYLVLLCSYEIHPSMMLQIMFPGVFGKLLMRRGAWGAWFHDVWTCSLQKLFLNIE
jgi:hypothetical protein